MRRIALVLSMLCLLGGLALCASFADENKEKTEKEKQKNPVAVVELEKGGTVEIELYQKETPIHVDNFIKLVKKGYYDGLVFHRVVPKFVAQTGDPTGTGSGGPGYTIKDEYSPFTHETGSVGMAKTPLPNSAGSQWYICLEPQPYLDCVKTDTPPGFKGYTVFGKVIKGMDLVQKIQVGDKMKKVTMKPTEEPKKTTQEEKPAEEPKKTE